MKKLLLGLCLLVACKDPRARPAPPLVDFSVAPSFKLTSPGAIQGSLYAYDADGLVDAILHVQSADSSFASDSTIFLTGEAELTLAVRWGVPAGLAVGTPVVVVAKVVDFVGFATSDTLFLTVQTAAEGVR